MCTQQQQQQQHPCKQEAYKTAIDGFQFQISRYNTWMNYYAIFVGALFIAFYKVFPHGSDADYFLPITIALLGWFTSLCWYASLLGNSTWANDWMATIGKIENNDSSIIEHVYSHAKPTGSTPSAPNPLPKYISTQKITAAFIGAVCWAWAAAIGYLFVAPCKGCDKFYWCLFGVIIGGIGITIICQIILNNCKCKFWSSNL